MAIEQIRVASPCPMDWKEMTGDAVVRHCDKCRLNVYNLSGMTTAEAEELLRSHTGRLCVRYYTRADGKVMTKDCKVGAQTKRARLAAAAVALFAVSVSIAGAFRMKPVNKAVYEQAKETARDKPFIGPIIEKIDPRPVIMGDIAAPISTHGGP